MKVLFLTLTLVIVVTLCGPTRATQQSRKEDASTKEGLKISLVSPKLKYKLSEKINLHVMLNNISYENIYVLGSLGWGHNASLLLHIRNAAGREIEPTAFPDDKIFVDLNDDSTFVKLRPRQFIGTSLVADPKFLNMHKPGKYSIYVEYFCKVPSSEVKQKPFWGHENGTIFSDLVWVELLP